MIRSPTRPQKQAVHCVEDAKLIGPTHLLEDAETPESNLRSNSHSFAIIDAV
jgi:hypothetical protein